MLVELLVFLAFWSTVVYTFGLFTFQDTFYLGTREKLLRYLFLPVSLPTFVVSFLLGKLAYLLFFEFEIE